jgi:glycerol-3-phosphate dehydrogenase
VVGGGIYGVAIAYEAAQRGARVALLEQADFGGGASWSSLRTIHGGVRHLQRLELGHLRESVRERRAWLKVAPEIVQPLEFVLPIQGGLKRATLPLGLAVADVLAADRNRKLPAGRRIGASRRLGRDAVLEAFPGLPPERLSGGVSWTDAQLTHHERLIVALLRGAVAAGAHVANYVAAVELLREGSRVVGVGARDLESSRGLEVRATMVVNAAGGGTGALLERAGIPSPFSFLRGVNLVLKRPLVAERALGLPSSGRYLFAVPFRGRSLLGTGYGGPEVRASVLGGHFLQEAQRVFAPLGLEAGDVDFLQSGLVPARGQGLETGTVVVDHQAKEGVPGLVSVVGAKYTTARAAAETVVDLAWKRLGGRGGRSRSAATPLEGARPLTGPLPEQAAWAVREEMALHLPDVLLRRVDLGTLRRPTAAEAEAVAAAMARELSWPGARVAREIESLEESYEAPALR